VDTTAAFKQRNLIGVWFQSPSTPFPFHPAIGFSAGPAKARRSWRAGYYNKNTQPLIPAGEINQVLPCLHGVKAGHVDPCWVAGMTGDTAFRWASREELAVGVVTKFNILWWYVS